MEDFKFDSYEGPMGPSALPIFFEQGFCSEDLPEFTHNDEFSHLLQELCQTEESPAPKDMREATKSVDKSCKSYCGKCHKYFHYMKKHELSHSGEKPYSCHECGRSFSQKSNLNRHVKSLHMSSFVGLFDCWHCGKQFKRKDKRNGHVRKVHPDKPLNNPAA